MQLFLSTMDKLHNIIDKMLVINPLSSFKNHMVYTFRTHKKLNQNKISIFTTVQTIFKSKINTHKTNNFVNNTRQRLSCFSLNKQSPISKNSKPVIIYSLKKPKNNSQLLVKIIKPTLQQKHKQLI